MKEFTTRVKDRVAEKSGEREGKLEWSQDGVVCVAYRPEPEIAGMIMAMTASHQPRPEQAAGIIEFFIVCLDDKTKDHLSRRLLDRSDDFGLDDIHDLLKWFMEEWSARPTQEPFGSTQQAPSSGQSSSPRIPA